MLWFASNGINVFVAIFQSQLDAIMVLPESLSSACILGIAMAERNIYKNDQYSVFMAFFLIVFINHAYRWIGYVVAFIGVLLELSGRTKLIIYTLKIVLASVLMWVCR